jgi:hypothetical protein
MNYLIATELDSIKNFIVTNKLEEHQLLSSN